MSIRNDLVNRLTAITTIAVAVATVGTVLIVVGGGGTGTAVVVVGRDVEMNMDVGSSCAGAYVEGGWVQ